MSADPPSQPVQNLSTGPETPAATGGQAGVPLKTPAKPRRNVGVVVLGIWVGVLLGALILVGLALSGVIPLDLNLAGSDGAPRVGELNQPAGDFSLQNLAGETVSLSGLRGQVVVVNFWATWCGPCIREMPMFSEFSEQYPQEIIILGINMQESESVVKGFIDSLPVSYPILLDPPGQVGRMYQVMALPNTLFIDQEGLLRFHHIGVISEAQFADYLQQLGVGK